jgi:hypothetical protein
MDGFLRRFSILAVCSVAGCYAAASAPGQKPATGLIANAQPHLAPGWDTYRNPDYGFEIDYPEKISSFGARPDPALMKGSYIPICETTTVACFEYNGKEYEGTNLESAGLSVNVLRQLRTEKDCDTFDENSGAVDVVKINGINFHRAITGSVGMSQGEGGPSYRALYQGVCFEIHAGIADVSVGSFEPGAIKSFDPEKLLKLLDGMVRTFRFTGDVVDGPAWKVYSDYGCGGSFEYPDGDTVVRTIEYSQAGFYSNDITCSQYFSNDGRDYTVAVKVPINDVSELNTWLKSLGLPDLSTAQVVAKSTSWTEYQVDPYVYVFGQSFVFILSVSDSEHHAITPKGDRVFSHLIETFRMK